MRSGPKVRFQTCLSFWATDEGTEESYVAARPLGTTRFVLWMTFPSTVRSPLLFDKLPGQNPRFQTAKMPNDRCQAAGLSRIGAWPGLPLAWGRSAKMPDDPCQTAGLSPIGARPGLIVLLILVPLPSCSA
jgi:hypothetical protein